jgi:Fe-S cluster biogenesis protein NfuA
MPQRDPSEEVVEEVASLLKEYILPSLAKRGGKE